MDLLFDCFVGQTVDESEALLMTSVPVQDFTLSVCQLVSEIAHAVEDLFPVKQDVYPKNLVTEWEEFFSEGIFTSLLPLFHRVTGKRFYIYCSCIDIIHVDTNCEFYNHRKIGRNLTTLKYFRNSFITYRIGLIDS